MVDAPNSLMGAMPPFSHEHDQWKIYKGRLEQFFNTMGVTDATKKKSAFLNYIGSKTYTLLFEL